MVSAYGTFATEGNFMPSSYILKIEDAQGNIIETNKKNPKKVLSIRTCRLINDILSDNDARAPMFGKKSALYFENYQVAAKTGTTDNYVDGWTIGYTPSLVVGVWAGNNDNSPTNKKPGVVLAGPIFHNFMGQSLPNFPKETFLKPLE
jgi:penicillin-binding protein 1A